MLDVTPLSLGIETMGGVMTKLIESNDHPDQEVRDIYDCQTTSLLLRIHILQGRRSLAKDNKSIGRFHLDGIPAAQRGVHSDRGYIRYRRQQYLERIRQDKGTGKVQNYPVSRLPAV